MINGLPEKLKKYRIKKGLSQREAAARLNVSASLVSSYESGDRTPSLEVLVAISYLYSCSVDYLLGKEPEMEEMLLLDGLTDDQVRLIKELIRQLKK